MSLDEQSDMILRQVGFKFGAKWADKTMIDKACEWLEEYIEPDNDEFDIDFNAMIYDFRKAMEE